MKLQSLLLSAGLLSLTGVAQAAVYDMTFYGNVNNGAVPANISGFSSVFHGRMEIADYALVPNGFVALGSDDFLDFDITIVSAGIGFNFKLDEDIFEYNKTTVLPQDRGIFGVRLDAAGQPYRFDSTTCDFCFGYVTDTTTNPFGYTVYMGTQADDTFNLVLLADGSIKQSTMLTPTDTVAAPFVGYWRFSNTTDNLPRYSWALWTITPAAPVPEPETYALMLAGLGLVGWAARRRAR